MALAACAASATVPCGTEEPRKNRGREGNGIVMEMKERAFFSLFFVGPMIHTEPGSTHFYASLMLLDIHCARDVAQSAPYCILHDAVIAIAIANHSSDNKQ